MSASFRVWTGLVAQLARTGRSYRLLVHPSTVLVATSQSHGSSCERDEKFEEKVASLDGHGSCSSSRSKRFLIIVIEMCASERYASKVVSLDQSPHRQGTASSLNCVSTSFFQ